MFAPVELPKRSDAPLLDAYVGHVQKVLDGLMEGLGNGSARTMTVTDLAGIGPAQPGEGVMKNKYQAQQSDIDRYKTHLGSLDSKVADIAGESAQVTNAAQREVANLYDVIAEIVHGVPGKPSIARQLDAIDGIDRAVGAAEQAVSAANTELADRADSISPPPVSNFAPPMSTGYAPAMSSSGGRPRAAYASVGNPASYAADGNTGAPIGGSVARAREMVYRYLTEQRHVPPAQAAAIAANIEKESAFNPAAWNDNWNGKEYENSYGLCQWRGNRLAALETFAGGRKGDWQVQLDFMLTELNGPGNGVPGTEANANRYFMAATNAKEAAAAFDQYYERSSGASTGDRASLADYIARTMASVAV
ncbi:phage tail tip lysozyme [Nocardia colli]|uniref:phage tail tip lysozyme n=1 Tax=Nocardia colli TaxID=2545717 RepID=UPI0035E1AD98